MVFGKNVKGELRSITPHPASPVKGEELAELQMDDCRFMMLHLQIEKGCSHFLRTPF